MPRGGIEIAKPDWDGLPKDQPKCGWCKKPMGDVTYVYFCKEANCWVHRQYVHPWLRGTDQGYAVITLKCGIHILDEGEI